MLRSSSMVGGAVCLVAELGLVLGGCTGLMEATAAQAQVSDYYEAGGTRFDVVVSLQEFGVVTVAETPADVPALLADLFAAQSIDRLAPNAFAVHLADPVTREALQLLARQAESMLDDVSVAGLIVRGGQGEPGLLTDEIIIRVEPGLSEDGLNRLLAREDATIVYENPFVEGQLLLRLNQSGADALAATRRYLEQPQVLDAYPNLIGFFTDQVE